MSKKHFVSDASSLVLEALRTHVAVNPSLALEESTRVVYNPSHSSKNVSIISGGGSGHEPAWSGFVGDGMLAAAVNGDIFGSPSCKQVLSGIASVPSEAGTILVITNYTGDKLHFGLACEKAKAAGRKNVAVLAVTDDVSIGRARSGMVGRRGLAGNVLALKILGAASETGWGFGRCLDIGRSVIANLATIGASLDFCHVPGRINHGSLADDVAVIGMGIHNEPGVQEVSPIPSTATLIDQMLDHLLDPNDPDRAFVKFDKTDEVVVLVNNFGGLSCLELGGLAQEALKQLETKWNIIPSRVFSGTFETSLNAPGFSVSILNVTAAAREAGCSAKQVFDLIDAPTFAPAWPRTKVPEHTANGGHHPSNSVAVTNGPNRPEAPFVEPEILENSVRRACQRAIDAEPDLTRWDMVMGDGDCGETVKAVCQSVLQKLDAGAASSGSIPQLLSAVSASIADMGGTLGAILDIFLTAFATNLDAQLTTIPTPPPSPSLKRGSDVEKLFPTAADAAIQSLKTYTGARVGDRTVMDVLIPFCEAMVGSGELGVAVEAAENAAEATKRMKPKFGRATYVTGKESGVYPPDPGAWAVMEMVKGLNEGIAGDV